MNVAKESSKPIAEMINCAREMIPIIQDVGMKQTLKFLTTDSGEALGRLVQAVQVAIPLSGEKQIDEAMQDFKATENIIDEAILLSKEGNLPIIIPREKASEEMKNALSSVLMATNELASVKNVKQVGGKAKIAGEAMINLGKVAKSLAATHDPTQQKSILLGTKSLLNDMTNLINQARSLASSNNQEDLNLIESSRLVAEKIRNLLSTTQSNKGAEECRMASIQVEESLVNLDLSPSYQPGDIVSRSADVEQRAKGLIMAINQIESLALSESVESKEQLKLAALAISTGLPALITSINKMVKAINDPSAQDSILKCNFFHILAYFNLI